MQINLIEYNNRSSIPRQLSLCLSYSVGKTHDRILRKIPNYVATSTDRVIEIPSKQSTKGPDRAAATVFSYVSGKGAGLLSGKYTFKHGHENLSSKSVPMDCLPHWRFPRRNSLKDDASETRQERNLKEESKPNREEDSKWTKSAGETVHPDRLTKPGNSEEMVPSIVLGT